jgi:hypothetical protein
MSATDDIADLFCNGDVDISFDDDDDDFDVAAIGKVDDAADFQRPTEGTAANFEEGLDVSGILPQEGASLLQLMFVVKCSL